MDAAPAPGNFWGHSASPWPVALPGLALQRVPPVSPARCAGQGPHWAPPLPSHHLGSPMPELVMFSTADTQSSGFGLGLVLFWFIFSTIDLVL